MNNKFYGYAALGAVIFLVFFASIKNTVMAAPVKYGLATNYQKQNIVLPDRLLIPSIALNADITGVGITKDGNLDVPPNFVQVGWYNRGPIPGQPGNAVLDGHVDNGYTVPGVFKKLRYAKVGDEIAVKMTDGSTVAFVITDSSVYKTNAWPGKSVFYGNGGSALKIITCHGKFIPGLNTYDERLIVTAVKKGTNSSQLAGN